MSEISQMTTQGNLDAHDLEVALRQRKDGRATSASHYTPDVEGLWGVYIDSYNRGYDMHSTTSAGMYKTLEEAESYKEHFDKSAIEASKFIFQDDNDLGTCRIAFIPMGKTPSPFTNIYSVRTWRASTDSLRVVEEINVSHVGNGDSLLNNQKIEWLLANPSEAVIKRFNDVEPEEIVSSKVLPENGAFGSANYGDDIEEVFLTFLPHNVVLS